MHFLRSLTAKAARPAKEKKSLTAKAAVDAKCKLLELTPRENAKTTPRDFRFIWKIVAQG